MSTDIFSLLKLKSLAMSIDVSGFDTNITYLNLHQIGLADREDTPCIAKVDYPSPLLGRIDGYVCTVNRFVIPTHTLFLNDRVKTAIVLYTFDEELWKDTGGQYAPGDAEHRITPLDIDKMRVAEPQAITAAQVAYFETEHAQTLADFGPVTLHDDDP
jgi:hypothetical protein